MPIYDACMHVLRVPGCPMGASGMTFLFAVTLVIELPNGPPGDVIGA